jgi:hypothetical protein
MDTNNSQGQKNGGIFSSGRKVVKGASCKGGKSHQVIDPFIILLLGFIIGLLLRENRSGF